MDKLCIDLWSDVACPWCYVGKRRLEAALQRFEHRQQVRIEWHAFELDPAAPRERDVHHGYAELLANKYRCPVERARDMIARMVEIGRGVGLELDFERIRPGNTFDAHRVLRLAEERGLQDAVAERLLRGYLSEGEAIGLPEVLARLGTEAGLDPEELASLLAGDAYTREVRQDEAEAAELGISGVPFFVFGRRYAVSGAQPPELLLEVLTRSWHDAERAASLIADGAACGPDGC